MDSLHWDGAQGSAALSGQRWALRAKPGLEFTYDSLSYQFGSGNKTTGSDVVPLSTAEVTHVQQWLAENDPHQGGVELVHGANASGLYLGLVPRQEAVYVLLGPPPSGNGWRWDHSNAAWAREPSLDEAKAQALKDIDAASDSLYHAVLGARAQEYNVARGQAQAFAQGGYNGAAPTSVASWAQAKNQTAQWAADDILATAALWEQAMQTIRAARLLAKEQVRSASGPNTVQQAQAAFTQALQTIRSNLGV